MIITVHPPLSAKCFPGVLRFLVFNGLFLGLFGQPGVVRWASFKHSDTFSSVMRTNSKKGREGTRASEREKTQDHSLSCLRFALLFSALLGCFVSFPAQVVSDEAAGQIIVVGRAGRLCKRGG